jgi:hypothetical protein
MRDYRAIVKEGGEKREHESARMENESARIRAFTPVAIACLGLARIVYGRVAENAEKNEFM